MGRIKRDELPIMNELPYIRVEIASTPSQYSKGLMWRKHLPEKSGMLFDFKEETPLTFWMKNTYIPLQIAFIDNSGRILQIESMAPMSTKRVYSRNECRYALEVNDGWFDKNSIKVGDHVAHPNGEWPKASKDSKFMLMSQVVVPTPVGIPPGGPETGMPGQEQQGVQPPPTMQILDSWLDIFKRADELGIPLVIEWQTKSGKTMPRTQVSPPYEFGETSEGEHSGLLIAWSDRDAHIISPIIENIIGVFDINGNSINSVGQVEQIGKAQPMTQEDTALAKGVQGFS